MANHKVVNTLQEPCPKPRTQAHIVEIGTDSGNRIWTIHEAAQAMQSGDVFYVFSRGTNDVALVHPYYCGSCGRPTLKTAPDAEKDNQLNNLPNRSI